MSWTDVIKIDSHLDDFLKDMKRINLSAQETYEEFDISKHEIEPTLEMQDLATSIFDMGNAILMLEKMKNRQEELR